MPTRVIIPQRLCTTKRFEERVRSEDHISNLTDSARRRIFGGRHFGDVLHDAFRSFGLAGSGFARDDDALILLVRCPARVVSRVW